MSQRASPSAYLILVGNVAIAAMVYYEAGPLVGAAVSLVILQLMMLGATLGKTLTRLEVITEIITLISEAVSSAGQAKADIISALLAATAVEEDAEQPRH